MNQSGASIYFDTPNKPSIVFQVLPTMTFNQFIFVNSFDEKQVVYPPGVDGSSDIYKFILNYENEQIVQLNQNGKNFLLKNKAW